MLNRKFLSASLIVSAVISSLLLTSCSSAPAPEPTEVPQISMTEHVPLEARPEWNPSSVAFLDEKIWAVQDIKKDAMKEMGEEVPQMYMAESKDGKCFIAYSITFVVNAPGYNNKISDEVLTKDNYKSLNLTGNGNYGKPVKTEKVLIANSAYDKPLAMLQTSFAQPIYASQPNGVSPTVKPDTIGTTNGVFISRVFNVDVPNDSVKSGNLSEDVLKRMTPAAVINYSCKNPEFDSKVLSDIIANAKLDMVLKK